MRLALPFVVIASLLSLTASAAELRVPQDFETIQAAINASFNGDVILVGPRTYVEALNLRGRRITLRSVAGAASTILDGTNLQTSIITARSGENLTTRIEGFTFRHGYGTTERVCNLPGPKGGAIFLLNAGLTITDCVFEDNGDPHGRGGAVFGCSADVAIASSRFDRNRVAFGGAVYYYGASTRRLTVARSTFRENAASFGGAIEAVLFQNAKLAISDSSFTGNDGGGNGGAVSVDGTGATRFSIERSTFTGNHSSHGGAVYGHFGSSAQATIAGSQFENGVSAFGGGVFVHASEDGLVEIRGCDFRGQEAGFGGGLYASASGIPVLDPGGRIRIDGCRFFDNVAHACCDAGLVVDTCVVDGPSPQGNGLYFGGGADLRTITGGTITVTNSLFSGNSAPRGGGVHAGSCAGGRIELVNCTIVDNTNGLDIRLGSPKLVDLTDVSTVTLTNSIVRGNGKGQVAIEHEHAPSTAEVTFSDVEGGHAGAGNFDVPASFVDPAARDYRLADGSACIDAGDDSAVDTTITQDLAGRPRIVDRIDLGAYEFHPVAGPRRRPIHR